MANIKAVTFHTDFCQDGVIKYEAGKSYPRNAETDRCVALNFGTSVTLNESFVSPLPVSAAVQAEAERIAAAAQAAISKAATISAAEDALAKAKSDAATAAQAALDAHVAAAETLEGAPKIDQTAIALALDDVAHAAAVEVEAAQQYLDGLLSA